MYFMHSSFKKGVNSLRGSFPGLLKEIFVRYDLEQASGQAHSISNALCHQVPFRPSMVGISGRRNTYGDIYRIAFHFTVLTLIIEHSPVRLTVASFPTSDSTTTQQR